MNKEQPDLFPDAKTPKKETTEEFIDEDDMTDEQEYPREVSDQIQAERKKRRADKKSAAESLKEARRKIMGENKEGQKEMFRE